MANCVSPNQIQIQIGLVLLVRPDRCDDTSQLTLGRALIGRTERSFISRLIAFFTQRVFGRIVDCVKFCQTNLKSCAMSTLVLLILPGSGCEDKSGIVGLTLTTPLPSRAPPSTRTSSSRGIKRSHYYLIKKILIHLS